MKNITYLIIIFCFVFIISLFSLIETDKKTYKNVDISVYNGLSSILFFIAKDFKYFEDEGLNIKFNLYNSGKKAVESLLKKEVYYANGSEFVGVKQSFKYNNIRLIASTSEASINGIIVKNKNFKKEIDIKDKNIATTIGTASEYYTGVFLEHIGLSIKDIKLHNLNANDTDSFLQNENIDGFFTWEPFIYNIISKNTKKDLTFFPLPKGYEFYFCLFVEKNELIKNKDTSEKILKALIKAENWMKQNPNKFDNYVIKKFNFSKNYYEYIKNNYNITVSLTTTMSDSMEDEALWLIENNLVNNKNSKNYMNLINRDILEGIDKSLVNLIKKQNEN